MKKIAEITARLDRIADGIQASHPEAALAIDRVSDHLERRAYSPQGWLPGRGMGPGIGRGYGMGWMPGRRFIGPAPMESGPAGYCQCPQCGMRQRFDLSRPMVGNCPQCGIKMEKIATR